MACIVSVFVINDKVHMVQVKGSFAKQVRLTKVKRLGMHRGSGLRGY